MVSICCVWISHILSYPGLKSMAINMAQVPFKSSHHHYCPENVMEKICFLLAIANTYYFQFANAVDLKPGGANVCSKSVTTTTTSTVSTQRVITEQYRTCCEQKWGTCINSCLKTRTKSAPEYRQVTTTGYQTVYSCCPDHEQVGDECVKKAASCNPVCQNGDCQADGTCSCQSGYEGDQCERDVNECNFITLNQCEQKCVNQDGGYKCECQSGYRLLTDGFKCQDIDECQDGIHGCDTKCVNSVGSYSCECNDGFKLDTTGKVCEDIDECGGDADNCDHQCVNSVGSFKCSCNQGFTLLNDGLTCEDVNECDFISLNGCQQHCMNKPGGFECSCNSGYSLAADGKSCKDVNECLDGTHACSQNCINLPGSYSCTCNIGYNLGDDGKLCQDVDECKEGSDNCQQSCANNDGSFSCGCLTGYVLAPDGFSCNDIDECADGTSTCSQNCVNTIASYTCTCRSGYKLHTDGKSCEDVNECQNGSHTCSQNCVNSVGSYSCTCNPGFNLESDEKSCQDVNECTDGSHTCSQNCVNSVGSYLCTCDQGYYLGADGKSCQDVNECTDGSHTCSQNCVNSLGSYSCTCDSGYYVGADGKSCLDVNECTDGVHKCSQNCVNSIGSYSCTCNAGYKIAIDGLICQDINECQTSSHGCEQECQNSIGSYRCSCIADYKLRSDGKTCEAIIKSNIVFLIGTASWIGKSRTVANNIVLEFINKISGKLQFSKVGVIHYDRNPRVIINLSVVNDVTSFKKSLKISSGSERVVQTDAAVNKAVEMLDDIKIGKKYIVMIGSGHTDSRGSSEGFYLGRSSAIKAMDKGIIIYGMLNGIYNDPEGLLSMVSYPKKELMVKVKSNAVEAASKVVEMLRYTSTGKCHDPLVDIAVLIGETCDCLRKHDVRKVAGTLSTHLTRLSNELSSDTAIGFYRRGRRTQNIFDEWKDASLLLDAMTRNLQPRGRRGKCGHRRRRGNRHRHRYGYGHHGYHNRHGHHSRRTISQLVESLYNKKFTEESSAIGKLKVAMIVSCKPLDETKVFSFNRLYPSEQIIPVNVAIGNSNGASTHTNDFNYNLNAIDSLSLYLKKKRDQSKVCFSA